MIRDKYITHLLPQKQVEPPPAPPAPDMGKIITQAIQDMGKISELNLVAITQAIQNLPPPVVNVPAHEVPKSPPRITGMEIERDAKGAMHRVIFIYEGQ